MSHYWNNHVEEYDEIMRRGMADYMIANGDTRDFDEIVEWLAEDPLPPHLQRKLELEANSHIVAAEQDYWGNKVDQAMMRSQL